jgi:hypothetical protein
LSIGDLTMGERISAVALLVSVLSLSLALWSRRRRLEVTLIPGTPNVGPDHVYVSLRIQNEGHRTYQVESAEARFDIRPVHRKVFKAGPTAFGHTRVVLPNATHHNNVRIPFVRIGEQWRAFRDSIPRGEMRIGLRDGGRTRFTPWISFNSGSIENQTRMEISLDRG